MFLELPAMVVRVCWCPWGVTCYYYRHSSGHLVTGNYHFVQQKLCAEHRRSGHGSGHWQRHRCGYWQVPRWPPAQVPRVTRPPAGLVRSAGLLRSAGLHRTQSACTLYTGRHPGRTRFTAPLSMARRGSQRRMRRATALRGPDAELRSAHHAAHVRCAVCRAQQRYRAQQRSSRCLVRGRAGRAKVLCSLVSGNPRARSMLWRSGQGQTCKRVCCPQRALRSRARRSRARRSAEVPCAEVPCAEVRGAEVPCAEVKRLRARGNGTGGLHRQA